MIEGLEERGNCFLKEAKGLNGEVRQKEEEAQLAMKKVNKSIEVMWKIQEYIENLNDVINRARLLNINLFKVRPLSSANVVVVLVDYACKMECFLEEMRSFFVRLEPKATSLSTPLERTSNLSINTEETLSLDISKGRGKQHQAIEGGSR